METCATRETQEELGVQVWRPTDRALWEAGWQHRPFYPSSNILGRLPNAVAITGTLVTPGPPPLPEHHITRCVQTPPGGAPHASPGARQPCKPRPDTKGLPLSPRYS